MTVVHIRSAQAWTCSWPDEYWGVGDIYIKQIMPENNVRLRWSFPKCANWKKQIKPKLFLHSNWPLNWIRRDMLCYNLMDEHVSDTSLCYVTVNEDFFYKRINFQGRKKAQWHDSWNLWFSFSQISSAEKPQCGRTRIHQVTQKYHRWDVQRQKLGNIFFPLNKCKQPVIEH